MALSLPLALATAHGILHRQQAGGLHDWLQARHLALFWMLMLMLAAVLEAGWQAEQFAPATPLWAFRGNVQTLFKLPDAHFSLLGTGLFWA